MLTVSIAGDGNISYLDVKDITTPHTGTTAYLNISRNSATDNNYSFKINGKVVKYVSSAEVKAGDISEGDKLVLTYAKDNDSTGFWLLLNKVNNAGTNAGLMSAADKEKLDGIAANANNYSLPIAGSNLGGVKSAATGTTAGRYYNVQINGDGTMKVNVPWTDTHEANWETNLKVGTANSTANDLTSGTQDTYIKVVENGAVHGKVKVVGSGSVEVSSSSNGELEIYGAPTSYNRLAEGDRSLSKNYVIRGIGDTIPNPTNYYLRGNGTWGPVIASLETPTLDDTSELKNTAASNGANVSVSGKLKFKDSSGANFDFILMVSATSFSSSSNGQVDFGYTVSLAGRYYPVFPVNKPAMKPFLIKVDPGSSNGDKATITVI